MTHTFAKGDLVEWRQPHDPSHKFNGGRGVVLYQQGSMLHVRKPCGSEGVWMAMKCTIISIHSLRSLLTCMRNGDINGTQL